MNTPVSKLLMATLSGSKGHFSGSSGRPSTTPGFKGIVGVVMIACEKGDSIGKLRIDRDNRLNIEYNNRIRFYLGFEGIKYAENFKITITGLHTIIDIEAT